MPQFRSPGQDGAWAPITIATAASILASACWINSRPIASRWSASTSLGRASAAPSAAAPLIDLSRVDGALPACRWAGRAAGRAGAGEILRRHRTPDRRRQQMIAEDRGETDQKNDGVN